MCDCIVGSRSHPWVQLQRKAIGPTVNASHVTLSAMLTSTRSQYELGGFPYPLGLESNNTGDFKKILLSNSVKRDELT